MSRSATASHPAEVSRMAAIDPEPPFRSAARKLPLTCCTRPLEISLSAYGKL